jgi:translation initiation factor IF-3
MEEFKQGLADISKVDQPPRKQGRQIVMILVPQKNMKKVEKNDDE